MTRRSRPILFTLVATAVLVGRRCQERVAAAPSTTASAAADRPSRVLIVLFDQMLSKYADEFDMPNFRMLRDAGTNFNNAYLGYMGSETVIAHNVLMSGQNPKNMGWVDEAYRDREGLLSADTNQMWTTGELTYGQFGTLIQDKGYPKLADYLQEAQPDKKFIVVGQKGYAVDSAAAESVFDTSDADIAVRFGGRSSSTPVAGAVTRPATPRSAAVTAAPDGVNVPTYIKDPFCGRFYVNSSLTYGTSTRVPVVDLPARRKPVRPRHRPRPPRRRQLGRGRGHGDDGERGLVRDVRHHGWHRQGRSHVGRRQ